jgi:hypothetical protein
MGEGPIGKKGCGRLENPFKKEVMKKSGDQHWRNFGIRL